ncbi:MAG: DUF6178 family protein, partial [Desulfatiglandales bacterium]
MGLDQKALSWEVISNLKEKSGSQLLDWILSLENPEKFVKGLSGVDFYWIVKKIGPDDALPLLEMADPRQWVSILDLEIWDRDRIDNLALSEWFFRFLEAQPERLVRMLFTEEGEILGSFFAYQNLEALGVTKDESYDVPEDYVTLDGTIYFRPKDPEHLEKVTKFLKYMAMTDFQRYFNFMINFGGIIPSEAEEELYRLRNMRIAEYGFLPFEEAMAIYSPLEPEKLIKRSETPSKVILDGSEEVSYYPLSLVEYGKSLVPRFLEGLEDPYLKDRMGIEFVSLVNQLISADGRIPEDENELKAYCVKGIRFLNLAFERFLKEGEDTLLGLLKEHHLITFFRVGVHMVMRLKWEVERWLKGAWFVGKGLDPIFFGDRWGNQLKGLMFKRPLYFCPGIGGDYREFEWIGELTEVAMEVKKVMVLDSLFESFEKRVALMEGIQDRDFRAALFTPFARACLSLDVNLRPLTKEEMINFFGLLRRGSVSKPYRIDESEKEFLDLWLSIAPQSEEEVKDTLKATLREIYRIFQEEYMWVDLGD